MNKNILEILKIAREKKKFNSEEEFKQSLKQIKDFDEKIIIDWDDGAGEEWARIIYQD